MKNIIRALFFLLIPLNSLAFNISLSSYNVSTRGFYEYNGDVVEASLNNCICNGFAPTKFNSAEVYAPSFNLSNYSVEVNNLTVPEIKISHTFENYDINLGVGFILKNKASVIQNLNYKETEKSNSLLCGEREDAFGNPIIDGKDAGEVCYGYEFSTSNAGVIITEQPVIDITIDWSPIIASDYRISILNISTIRMDKLRFLLGVGSVFSTRDIKKQNGFIKLKSFEGNSTTTVQLTAEANAPKIVAYPNLHIGIIAKTFSNLYFSIEYNAFIEMYSRSTISITREEETVDTKESGYYNIEKGASVFKLRSRVTQVISGGIGYYF